MFISSFSLDMRIPLRVRECVRDSHMCLSQCEDSCIENPFKSAFRIIRVISGCQMGPKEPTGRTGRMFAKYDGLVS